MSTLIAERRSVARKVHRCEPCGGAIDVGDVYLRQRIVDGGDAWTFKAHALCDAVARRLWRELGLVEDDMIDPAEHAAAVHDVLAPLLWAPPREAGIPA